MSMLKEFREFAVKGNVVDMAVGLVIGAGFGKIVSSLVSDILMPPLGLVIGGVDFTSLKLILLEKTATTPGVTINYGTFIQTVFDFTIVAFAMFSVIKIMNKIKKHSEAAPAKTNEEILLGEIRDLLKEKR